MRYTHTRAQNCIPDVGDSEELKCDAVYDLKVSTGAQN